MIDGHYNVCGQESIDAEIITKTEQFFSDYPSVAQDAIEIVRDIMEHLILAVVQNSNPLTFTTDIGRAAEEGGYYYYAQGTCLFHFILYGLEVETNHEEIVFIIAFQSYASISTRTFYVRFTGIYKYIDFRLLKSRICHW
jgi:hypothetical protein